MSGNLRELRALGQSAAWADDAALGRLVALLDQLGDRGVADAVLDPVRPRLRTLRPPRRLRFARLLFLPLDGAIQSPKQWKRGTPTVPRSALAVIAGAVCAALGPEGEAIAAACNGQTTSDHGIIAELGARLWPRAAEALPPAPPEPWAQTGLTPADYAAIAALCRPIWAQGPALFRATAAGPKGPPEDLVRKALAGLAPAGAGPLAAGLATLLLRSTAPGVVAQIAASVAPQARAVAVQALETMLAEPPPPFRALDPQAATEAALALVQRLDDLANCALLTGERQHQVAALRRAADDECRAGYLAATETQVLGPANALVKATLVADADVAAMEDGARRLRALEAAGRKLGSAPSYDKAVRTLTGSLVALGGQIAPGGAGLLPADLARSIEILAGPEAAEAALAALRAQLSA